jgi:DNA-binding transcriptional regulator YhcF (GntR family)
VSEQLPDKSPLVDHPAFETLVVDRDAEVPIGIQLAWALRTRIGDGQLSPGQRLPGLRDLAEASGVNVNTVRAVYQRLEQEGLIESQQGSGTFVTATPRRPSPAGKIAAGAAREAYETGVDPREVAAALYVAAEPPNARRDAAAEQRRVLRAQIAALERTLAEMEAAYPGLLAMPSGAGSGIGPALLSAGELEQVRAELVRRLARLQAGIDGELGRNEEPAHPAAERSSAPKPASETAKKRASRPRSTTRPAPAGT